MTMIDENYKKDFKIRMRIPIMYHYLVRNTCKPIWAEFGFPSDKQTWVATVISVLSHISQCAILDEPCTMEEVAGFLADFCSEIYRIRKPRGDYIKLSRFILQDVLTNNGKPMDIYPWEPGDKTDYISFISADYREDENGKTRAVYHMTNDGYSLIFGTKEFFEFYNIDIQNMVFRKRLEEKNYHDALDKIRQIYSMLAAQKQKIITETNNIRRNVMNYEEEKYASLLQDDISSLRESNQKYREFQEIIREHMNGIEESGLSREDVNEKNKEALHDLNRIQQYLNRIIAEQNNIIHEHEHLKAVFREELISAIRLSGGERISFERSYLNAVLHNLTLVEDFMESVIGPIDIRPFGKIYDPLMAFIPMESPHEPDMEAGLAEGFDKEEEIRKENEKKRKKEKEIRTILQFLWEQLSKSKDGRFALSDIEKELNRDSKARQCLFPNVPIFLYVYNKLFQENFLEEESKRSHVGNTFLSIIEEDLSQMFAVKITKGDRELVIEDIEGERLSFTDLIFMIETEG